MIKTLSVLTTACPALLAAEAVGNPLSLHPDNPHYFLFRDEPLVLVTSAEHYGAVLNLDFDYRLYLKTLARDGMNHTRVFVGAYCEPAGAFRIAGNTLAPQPGRFIAPWARSDREGYAGGGNRFDLKRWDRAYFRRLRHVVATASDLGIVIEINLFCPFYADKMWDLSPMNARNNVNHIGNVGREQVYILDGERELLEVQEAMTRKIVTELKGFDNIYYEIMNEPYQRGVSLQWQYHIVDIIRDTEDGLGVHHLISRNVANGKARVDDPNPEIAILNFHYAWPPDAVGMNYGLNRVIGDNETGFKGTGDFHYRREGWAFILAGGGLYNNLDYSFSVGHEDGTFEYPDTQPGGGGPTLRKQLCHLSEFIHSFDVVRMSPARGLLANALPEGTACFILAEEGRQVAAYLCRTGKATEESTVDLVLNLPDGTYRTHWLDPVTGRKAEVDRITVTDTTCRLTSPPFREDIALDLRVP